MKHLRPVAIGLLAAALFTACKPAPPAAEQAATPGSASTGAQAAKAFDALLDKQWQSQLQHNPEFASIIGDKRYNDRWSDYSLAACKQSAPQRPTCSSSSKRWMPGRWTSNASSACR